MASRLSTCTGFIWICFVVFALAACGGGGDEIGSIRIETPLNNAEVSENILVEGLCSGIDSLIVTIDNDTFSQQAVDCNRGNWRTDFDTTRFQDGDHTLVAYTSDSVRDQILIRTVNGNLDGHAVTVPVELGDGLYDEISIYSPLYVYAKRTSNGMITGQRFTSGYFPEEFVIPNLLNGVYEIGAVLDRNNNEKLDEGFDFSGTAVDLLEVSNSAVTSGVVVLQYSPEPDTGDEGDIPPGDIEGTLYIEDPRDNDQVSGLMTVTGYANGNIEKVFIELDGNHFSAQSAEIRRDNQFSADFDTTRLQDGIHWVRAYATEEISDVVFFETVNGNVQGYTVAVTVDLTDSIYDEISMYKPLYVYAEDPVTGGRIMARHESGQWEESFAILNVPNNTYHIGAFLDRNNDGMENDGDYAGLAADLLTVWYADAASEVVLVGNEVHITTPQPYADIRANLVNMAGTYTFNPDDIIVLMHLTGATYRTVEADAVFNDGQWSALLDITDVTQEGTRWLYVKARYGARWHWDSVLIDLDRNFERGITITSPADGATISSDALTVSGEYSGVPESISVTIERGDGTVIQTAAVFDNGTWSALFEDITSVQEGYGRTVTAVADYSPGISEQDSIDLHISRTPVTGVAITVPLEDATIDSSSLLVLGTYEGSPNAISISIEQGSGGTLDQAAVFDDGSWSAQFDDITSVSNGTRTITAVADYGGGTTAVDTILVDVALPTTGKSFTYRMVVSSPTASGAYPLMWFNVNPDCPNNESGSLPWVREETIEMPYDSTDPREWCSGVHNEIWLGLGANLVAEEGTVEIFLNGSDVPFVTDTGDYPYVQMSAYWDGDPDHDIVFEVQ